MADTINNLVTSVEHQSARGGTAAASSIAKHTLKFFGLPFASVLVAGMDIWDYMFQRNSLVTQYADEIGARLGIKPEQVTAKDLAHVAKENPTINEALKRLKRDRNMNMVTNLACVAGTFALGIGLFSGLAVPLILVGIGGFIVSKLVADVIGKRVLGLHEPSIKNVKKNPYLQDKLSLPSQVTYIEQLQNSGKKISSYQIERVFAKAGTAIAPAEAEAISDKLNQHVMEATELAFIVYGQRSGNPENGNPELTRRDKIIQGLQERVATTEQKLSQVSSTAKERAGGAVDSAKEKATDVVGAAKDKLADVGEWTKRVGGNIRSSKITPEAIQQERQQQSSSGISV